MVKVLAANQISYSNQHLPKGLLHLPTLTTYPIYVFII